MTIGNLDESMLLGPRDADSTPPARLATNPNLFEKLNVIWPLAAIAPTKSVHLFLLSSGISEI